MSDVMRRVFAAVTIAGTLVMAGPAFAQAPPPPPPPPPATTPAAPTPTAPRPAAPAPAVATPARAAAPAQASTDHGVSIAGTGGVAAVQNVGPTAAGMLTVRVSDRVDVIGEGVWVQDVAPRRRIETATTVATYLQTSQGKIATGTVEVPAFIAGGGVRIMLAPPGHVRPYVVATGGIAKMALRPTFLLSGTDITANLPQYGVTLGSDLTGEITKPAFGGGIGVLVDRGRWYVDASFRVLSIQTEGQPTNVLRAGGGIGIKF